MRPLSPTTKKLYTRVLERAFGPGASPPFAVGGEVNEWPESIKALLRAAVARAYLEAKRPHVETAEALEKIEIKWAPSRVVEIPQEQEMVQYQAACDQLPPGRRALALLPFATGLRARELLTLTRHSVERAAEYGELIVLRKGGVEQRLPAGHAKSLWEELLSVKSAKLFRLHGEIVQEGKNWKVVRQILSTGSLESAYSALHRLVRDTGEAAGLKGLRPHLLRHAFATRMNRDGAPLTFIQWALNHSNVATTMRYVHPGASDAAKYMREF